MTTRTGTATLFRWFRPIADVREAIPSKVTFWRFCVDLKRTVLTSSENVVIICAKIRSTQRAVLQYFARKIDPVLRLAGKTKYICWETFFKKFL